MSTPMVPAAEYENLMINSHHCRLKRVHKHPTMAAENYEGIYKVIRSNESNDDPVVVWRAIMADYDRDTVRHYLQIIKYKLRQYNSLQPAENFLPPSNSHRKKCLAGLKARIITSFPLTMRVSIIPPKPSTKSQNLTKPSQQPTSSAPASASKTPTSPS